MGLTITSKDKGPYPRRIRLILHCDNSHGFFSAPSAVIEHDDGFMGAYSKALRMGWKDTFEDGKRVFLCPQCSRKSGQNLENYR